MTGPGIAKWVARHISEKRKFPRVLRQLAANLRIASLLPEGKQTVDPFYHGSVRKIDLYDHIAEAYCPIRRGLPQANIPPTILYQCSC